MRIPLGVLLCGLAAWLVFDAARRLTPRLLPAPPSRSEGLLRVLLIAMLMVISPVALLGFVGALFALPILVICVVFFQRLPSPPVIEGGAPVPTGLRWPAMLTLGLIVLDLVAYLPASPVDWDAVTYHLYLPARWLQEGRLFHVPTVFSDNAAAFAPQNGALFFTWQMALTGRDAVVNVSQLLCLTFLGLALYRASRLLGCGRGPAGLAALTLPWLEPIRRWTYSANVDVFMVAFAFGALYWMLAYRHRPTRATAAAAGLAAGLAAGTKTLGLPLAVLSTLPLIWTAARRLRWADLGIFGGCAFAAGGWWYVLNVWRYGNPLFPVTWSFGPFELPGAYGSEAIRAGEFHLESLGEVMVAVVGQYGVTTCLLALLGLFALILCGAGDLRHRSGGGALMLLLLALAWAVLFFAVVPHNNQTRFLMPTLVASLAGWALLLDRVGRRSTRAVQVIWLGGMVAAAMASRPWQGWLESFGILDQAEVGAGRWMMTVVLVSSIAAGAYALRHRIDTRLPAIVGWTALWALITIATHYADVARLAYFASADYRGWAEGYLPFNELDGPPLRIAYTGANVPYALAGVGWRHRVLYVDTQGQQGDSFYQHWSLARRQYPYHKPGLYRGRDDAELWLRRLEELSIDTVVIFALHRAERRTIRSTPEGFPVEQAWVREHPERFEPMFIGRVAEMYRFLPPARDPE